MCELPAFEWIDLSFGVLSVHVVTKKLTIAAVKFQEQG